MVFLKLWERRGRRTRHPGDAETLARFFPKLFLRTHHLIDEILGLMNFLEMRARFLRRRHQAAAALTLNSTLKALSPMRMPRPSSRTTVTSWNRSRSSLLNV